MCCTHTLNIERDLIVRFLSATMRCFEVMRLAIQQLLLCFVDNVQWTWGVTRGVSAKYSVQVRTLWVTLCWR